MAKVLRMYGGADKAFLKACALAKTPPTRRQFTKYSRQRRGAAYAFRREAEAEAELDK